MWIAWLVSDDLSGATSKKKSLIWLIEHNFVRRGCPIVKLGPQAYWVGEGEDDIELEEETNHVGEVKQRWFR